MEEKKEIEDKEQFSSPEKIKKKAFPFGFIWKWIWLNFAVLPESTVEDESVQSPNRPNLKPSSSMGNLYSKETTESSQKEPRKGINKDKIIEMLSLLPKTDFKSKFNALFTKILIGKMLSILFPRHKKLASKNFSSKDGKNFMLRKLTLEESYLRGIEVPLFPMEMKDEMLKEIRDEIYNRNSARNLLALSEISCKKSDKNDNSDNKWNEFILQIENRVEKENNKKMESDEDDTEEIYPALLRMKNHSHHNKKVFRSSTLPILEVVPSLENCKIEIQKSLASQLVLRVAISEAKPDIYGKYRGVQGGLLKVGSEVRYISSYIKKLGSVLLEKEVEVEENEVEKEMEIMEEQRKIRSKRKLGNDKNKQKKKIKRKK